MSGDTMSIIRLTVHKSARINRNTSDLVATARPEPHAPLPLPLIQNIRLAVSRPRRPYRPHINHNRSFRALPIQAAATRNGNAIDARTPKRSYDYPFQRTAPHSLPHEVHIASVHFPQILGQSKRLRELGFEAYANLGVSAVSPGTLDCDPALVGLSGLWVFLIGKKVLTV